MNIGTPLTPRWQHVHADWWQDNRGNDIHRVEIDDDALYHCHLAGSPLPWNAVARSLDEAMAVVDEGPAPSSPEACRARGEARH
ncbi:hypothetical protein [Halomonas sp. M4R1S46]|uniref:hypothetical protein n=1 Tax=Halomonas sp. M4R1S46 TaxID=2982692 RepID=UPI0021E43B8F|nr:hypothetical protein [Halomonas sp. M4R1S46]UYG09639.1 hypothetical protein OCT48_09980 [Halomonas sp. M4R1S46]